MRALISVYNKDGLDKLCKTLYSSGCEIYSTGGTLSYIKNLGINVHYLMAQLLVKALSLLA